MLSHRAHQLEGISCSPGYKQAVFSAVAGSYQLLYQSGSGKGIHRTCNGLLTRSLGAEPLRRDPLPITLLKK